jgi:membrane fusion protein (multidrug efflux system)
VSLEQAASAAVDAARAAAERAVIDLSYTRITAPDTGVIGKTEVYAGTLVGRGQSTLLTRISRVDPIHVRMSIPEKDYLELSRNKGASTEDREHADIFQMVLADGTVYPHPGKLVFVDRSVDARTGTMMVSVTFPSARSCGRGRHARPRHRGYRGRRAARSAARGAKVQGVYNVMVVTGGNTAEQRLVTPAERVGALWRISSGLKDGERVIVEGLQKVRPGMKVTPELVQLEAAEAGQEPAPAAAGAAGPH